MTDNFINPLEEEDVHPDVDEVDVTHHVEDEEDAESLIGEPVDYDLGSDDDE